MNDDEKVYLYDRAEMLKRQRDTAEEERDGWKLRAMQSEQQRQAARKYLLDLLAVVHGDGGHHTEAVGTRQSVVDAELAFYALRQRAEAAEAERYNVSSQLWDCMNEREGLRAECDALRQVDDAMVERAARSLHANRESVFTHGARIEWKNCGEHWHEKLRGAARAAITAALAVQPTTGEGA